MTDDTQQAEAQNDAQNDGFNQTDGPLEGAAPFDPDSVLFDFSGATLGGRSLLVCGLCRALVRDGDERGHAYWHGDVITQ